MTDTNTTPIGLGIDFRVTGIAGALSDGQSAELLAGPAGESRSPAELHATDVGVRARPPNHTPDPTRRIRVLPQYGSGETDRYSQSAARFELEIESLFSDLVDGWRKSAPDTLQTLGYDEALDDELPPSAVVSVPGVFDREDRATVFRSVEAAGLDVGAVVRAPVAVAAAEFPAISEPQLLVVVDIGTYWFDAAVVGVDPDEVTYHVLARVSAEGLGRDAMDEALAEWAIEQTAREENQRVTYDEKSIEHLREAADDALDDVASDTDGSIVAEEVPGLTSEDGLTLDVDIDVDMSDAYEALEDVENGVIDRLRELFDSTDVDRPDVDRVLVTGPGADPVPVENAVSGFLDRPLSEPRLGARETASSRGVAMLAAQLREADKTPVRQETLDRDVGVLVPSDEGVVFETVVPGSTSLGESRDVTLKTVRDDQTRGRVTVATRHRGTGEVTPERSYDVTGLPPRQAGEARVGLTVTVRSVEEGGIEVSPFLPADGESTPSLHAPTETAPWLTRLGEDLTDLDTPDVDERTLATRAEISEDPLENLSPRSVLGRIMSVRYNLWHTTRADASLEPSDVENLLKEFTSGMRRLGVEPIEPAPGDEKDLEEHTVWKTRPSEAPDGTVLEVRKPGYRIGDFVEQTADVIVSKGEPEPADDAPSDEPETATDTESVESALESRTTGEASPEDATPERGSTGEDQAGDDGHDHRRESDEER